METNTSMEPHLPSEIAPTVEIFGTELNQFLRHMGLPNENILVPYERRGPVFNNMPTVVGYLADKHKSEAVYISKFVAACAVGLFDAALNYLWDETVRNLRTKVANFDLAYFFDSAVSDSNRRSKLQSESDLEKIDDWELIRGCHATGIITNIGFRHLDYIRDMRNHASAAHPNQNELTGLQMVGWLETCILEVLGKEPGGPAVEVRRLLRNLRTEKITESDVQPIADALSSLPEDLSASLLRSVVGIYTDADTDAQVRDNVRLVAPSIWAVVSDEARREVGLKEATLAANAEVARARLTREFIEIVQGQEFLAETTLAAEISIAVDGLMTAHYGWHNFYNELTPARVLYQLIPDTGNVPKSVLVKYVKSLTMCSIGNGFGVSFAAAPYYQDLLMKFSADHIFAFINLVQDSDVASRLQMPSCATRYQNIAANLKDRAVRPRLKEMLTFIEEYPRERLRNVASDSRYRQLRRTLQI